MAKDNWATPQNIFDTLNREFNFDIDICASDENHKCDMYFTEEQNSLDIAWESVGHRIWCNPPYSKVMPWVLSSIEAQTSKAKPALTCMFVMCDPSVKWFSKAAQYASEIRFVTNGRVAFIDPDTGKPQGGNNKGTVIFIFDPHRIGTGYVSFVDRERLING